MAVFRYQSGQEPLFFLHIPKTAGTSVRKMLYELYRPREIFPNMAEIRKQETLYCNYQMFQQRLKQQKREIRLLMGHLPFVAGDFPDARFFTFLRDPVQRALSNLKHFQRHKGRFDGKSLLEIYNHADIRIGQVDNIQVKYLAPGPVDQTITGWKQGAIDEERLEALQNRRWPVAPGPDPVDEVGPRQVEHVGGYRVAAMFEVV